MQTIQKGLILLLSIFLTISLIGQKDYNSYKKELNSLEGSAFITIAFEGAELLASQKEYKDAIDLMDRAVKEARSLSNSTYNVVLLEKVKLMAKAFPADKSNSKEALKTLKRVIDDKTPTSLIKDAISVYETLESKYTGNLKADISNDLREARAYLSDKETQSIVNMKTEELNEFKKMNTNEAFLELERIKEEKEKLAGIQEKLSQTIDQSEKLLNKRAFQINKMSQDQAKKEAILQFNMRIIDSLKFMAQMDSISIINQGHLIKEQESRLELQSTILQLQDSEIMLKDSELKLKASQQRLYMALSLLGLLIAGFLSWAIISSRRSNRQLALKNEQIEKEKERSESLLLNILPHFIAQELKEKSKVTTRMMEQCTVLFTDFVNFSTITKQLTPIELIATLDECFRAFDMIISKHNIEKIKTIGDSYMCAGGVPIASETHAIDAVNAAFEMVEFLEKWNNKREQNNLVRFDARIGIHSGPLIAGVVGAKKFAYDIWGDTVNVASRMESQSAAQRINISSATYELIKDHYECIERGHLSVKNMPDIEMYYVDSKLNVA